MKIKDIMSTSLISVSPEDSISNLISLIEKHCLREVLVVDNKKMKGIIYAKELAKKGIIDPTKAKVNILMNFPPPSLSPNDEVDVAANMIFKTGLRAMPVVDKDNVIGIVSLHDVIQMASKSKNFKQALAESIMSPPESMMGDADIGAARKFMRERNVSRIPIVDKENKLKGIVTLFDILRAVKPRERMNFYSMAAEKETTMGIPVSSVMNDTPTEIERETSLSEIAGLLKKYDTDGVVVTDNQMPVGVITEKDLLEFYVSTLGQKGVYYQIMGLSDEDDFVLSTVNRMIGDTLQKLSKIHKINFFYMHVKRHDKAGKIKYSIRNRLLTDSGTFISKSYDWDIRSAVDQSLDKLERLTIKDKEWKMERKRGMAKYNKSRA
jgi:CBS domain-containing protein